MPPSHTSLLFPVQYLRLTRLCEMPQLLPSLGPHAPDVAGHPDPLGSNGEREQGANTCYQSERKQKGLILEPQSLTCGQKNSVVQSIWFREARSWALPSIFSLWVWMNRGRRRRKRTWRFKRIAENSADLWRGDHSREQWGERWLRSPLCFYQTVFFHQNVLNMLALPQEQIYNISPQSSSIPGYA